jgi:hypothetical protein
MATSSTEPGDFGFEGEPHNPISGGSGYVHELLADLSDQELAEYCRYWTWYSNELRAEGRGFGAWKSSNQLSAGYREADRRNLDTEALRGGIEAALAE